MKPEKGLRFAVGEEYRVYKITATLSEVLMPHTAKCVRLIRGKASKRIAVFDIGGKAMSYLCNLDTCIVEKCGINKLVRCDVAIHESAAYLPFPERIEYVRICAEDIIS